MKIVPPTSARPTPTGNATDMPATAIAAESRMFERLNTTPAANGQSQVTPKLALRLAMKPQFAFSPQLPSVRPIASAKASRPIT